jgi:hypothetical protein
VNSAKKLCVLCGKNSQEQKWHQLELGIFQLQLTIKLCELPKASKLRI